MVMFSKFPSLDIPEVSFYKYFADILKEHGDKVALIDAGTERQLTFNEIRKSSFKLASALTRKGLKKQEVVALCTSNCIEYPLMVLGVSACNAITTTCNPLYTIDETMKQFENSQPKFVFTDSAQLSKMMEIAKRIPSIQEIFTIEANTSCTSIRSLSCDDGTMFPHDTSVDVHEDVVLLLYSSGTTGLPKGVMHTHYSSVALQLLLRALGISAPSLIGYDCIPLFHAMGLARTMFYLNGTKHIIDERFNVESVLKAVEKYKVTFYTGVPAMVTQILNSSLLGKYDISSLKVIGTAGSSLSPNLTINAIQKIKVPCVQSYGLTESMVNATSPGVPVPLNSVGYLIPNTKLKVVDPETRRELGTNEDGELLFKGPHVMKGYFKNQEATAAAFEEGWLCTGDIGHYDENGILYIVDRFKELIKYKSFQVAPAELELFIMEHPKVSDVGVVGIKDVDAGEVPKAFVIKKDQSLTVNELNQFMEGKVSKYKYLRGGIQFVDEIPRNITGKIMRRKLREIKPKHVSKL